MDFDGPEQRGPGAPPAEEQELFSAEVEAALLGAMMMNNEIVGECLSQLRDDDFYVPAHQKLWQLISHQVENGKAANPVTLNYIAKRDPLLKNAGGAAYLAQLTGSHAGLIGWRDFLAQVVELGRMREIELAAQDAKALFLAGTHGITEATAALDEALGRAVYLEKPIEVLTGGDMIRKVRARSDRILEQGMNTVGPTCATISDLNVLFGPLEPGTYILIAGRPGMGKTSLANSGAWGYAANGHPGLYLAAEGTDETLAMRFMSDLSLAGGFAIQHDAIKRDKLTPTERHEMDRLEQRAETLPIEYQVIDRIDVRRVRAYVARSAARWRAKGRKLAHVWVDYLQLLAATSGGKDIEDDRRRVNAVSAALLGIAKDFGVTLFAMSQLTRGVEARQDKRPNIADLRESGRLEEDADIVLLLYREEYYLADAKPQEGVKDYAALLEDWEIRMGKCRDRIDFILGKNRHGERRTRTGRFFGAHYAVRGGDYSTDGSPDETGWIL